MSSIIDALKKSAQNRSSNNDSAANSINFSQTEQPKSRRGFWLLTGALLLLAGGLFAWQQGWHHGVIHRAKAWLGTAPNDTTQVAKQTKRQTEPQPMVERQPTQQPPASKLTPPKAADVKAQSVAEKDRQAKQNRQQADTTDSQAVAQNPAAEVTAPPKASSDQQDEVITVVENRNAQTATKDPASPSKPSADDRAMLQPQLKQDYLLIHQIDFAIRKNIPPIKINIHIFDPDPDKRMVMMNGVKFLTGDVIEEVVTVDEIVKEGVVLKFDNIRFLVPK